jgi:hypothetical protein
MSTDKQQVAHEITLDPQAQQKVMDYINAHKPPETPRPSENPEDKQEPLSVMLGEYGLQEPEQVADFFKTPTGIAVQADMLKQIEIKKELETGLREELEEKERRMQLIKGALILWALSKNARAKERVEEAIRFVQEKLESLREESEARRLAAASSSEKSKEALIAEQRKYEEILLQAEATQLELSKQEEALMIEKGEIDLDKAEMLAKHDIFKGLLDFSDLSGDEHLPPEDLTEAHLEEGRAANTRIIGDLIDKLRVAMGKVEDVFEDILGIDKLDEAPDLHEAETPSEAGDAEIPSADVEEDSSIHTIIHKLHGRHLRAMALDEMLAVKKGESHCFSEDGSACHYHHEAAFVLPIKDKIVKHGDKLYLIPSTQSLDDLDDEARSKANKRFEEEAPNLRPTMRVVTEHQTLELAQHARREAKHQQRLEANQAAKTEVQNQIRGIQGLQAGIKGEIALLERTAGQLQPPANTGIAPVIGSAPQSGGTGPGSAPETAPRPTPTTSRGSSAITTAATASKVSGTKGSGQVAAHQAAEQLQPTPQQLSAAAQQAVQKKILQGSDILRMSPEARMKHFRAQLQRGGGVVTGADPALTPTTEDDTPKSKPLSPFSMEPKPTDTN